VARTIGANDWRSAQFIMFTLRQGEHSERSRKLLKIYSARRLTSSSNLMKLRLGLKRLRNSAR